MQNCQTNFFYSELKFRNWDGLMARLELQLGSGLSCGSARLELMQIVGSGSDGWHRTLPVRFNRSNRGRGL